MARRIHNASAGDQTAPQVVALRDGGFLALWVDGPTAQVRGQAFADDGREAGPEFTVGETPVAAGAGGDLAAALLADGRVVVTWTGIEEDGSAGVRSQVLDPRDGIVTGTALGDGLWGHDQAADQMTGLGGDDILRGLGGEDWLRGGQGQDTLFGGRGEDSLDGGAGDDALNGGAGADALSGGAGTDRASYATAVTVALDGSLVATGEAAGDVLAGVEGLAGSPLDDRLRGDGGANVLVGNAGADRLEGQGGDDVLYGGAGDDALTGGGGRDVLGDATGLDRFVFLDLADSAASAARDRVIGFGAGDRVVLTAIDAVAGGADGAFALDAGGAFSAGEIRQRVTASGLLLEMNVDADATPEMSLFLAGLAAPLTAAAFDL